MTIDPKLWANRTPGEYRFLEADDAEEGSNAGRPLTICDDQNNDLGNVYSRDDSTVSITREQAVANAHLFAHAPEIEAERVRLVARVAELEGALVAHNEMLRSAFQAAQRDAVHDVQGTTRYGALADSIHKVLGQYHGLTNSARAALGPTP